MSKHDKEILRSIDKETFKAEVILHADKLYAVCYDSDPVSLRSENHLSDVNKRYRKTVFTSKARAITLAQRMNSLFRTNKFTVRMLTVAEQIAP